MAPIRFEVDKQTWKDLDLFDQGRGGMIFNLFNKKVKTAGGSRALEGMLQGPCNERQVLEGVERANRGPLSSAAIRRLFERILDEARSVERHVMEDREKADGGGH